MKEVSAMTAMLSMFTEIFTWIITSLGTFCTTVLGNPILAFGLGITAIYVVIGIYKRVTA